jgi:hypothetical protein
MFQLLPFVIFSHRYSHTGRFQICNHFSHQFSLPKDLLKLNYSALLHIHSSNEQAHLAGDGHVDMALVVSVIDAFGKPGPGLMDYSLQFVGNFDECIAIQADRYIDPANKQGLDHPYTGKYCTGHVQLSKGVRLRAFYHFAQICATQISYLKTNTVLKTINILFYTRKYCK